MLEVVRHEKRLYKWPKAKVAEAQSLTLKYNFT